MQYSADQLLFSLFLELLLQTVLPPDSQPEIDKFKIGRILPQKQEILRFKVPVSNFLLVEIVNALHHLLEQHSSITFAETAGLVESVEKLSPVAEAELTHFYSVTMYTQLLY